MGPPGDARGGLEAGESDGDADGHRRDSATSTNPWAGIFFTEGYRRVGWMAFKRSVGVSERI